MRGCFTFLLVLIILQTVLFAENSTVLYKRGVDFYKAGNLSDAEKSFKDSINVNPSYTLGHYGLGRIYLLQKGKVNDAIKQLKISVKLDRNFARGWFKLGLAQLVAGKYIDSLHSFKTAYDRDKTFIESLYNIGVIYDLLGEDFKAFTYYREYYRKVKGEKKEFF